MRLTIGSVAARAARFARVLEPFAVDLWYHDIRAWLPEDVAPKEIRKQTFYGGLYQKLAITR